MLVSAQEAIGEYPDVQVFWRKLHYAQVHYVEEKLQSDLVHNLEREEDFIALLQVYQRLLLVFPTSKKLMNRISKVQKKKDKQTMSEQEDALKVAESRITKYMASGELEKALTACYEILSYLPTHKPSLRLRAKILKKREKQINKELGPVFNKSYELVRQQYKADKKSVLRI